MIKEIKKNKLFMFCLLLVIIIFIIICVYNKKIQFLEDNEVFIPIYFETEDGIYGKLEKESEKFLCNIAIKWPEEYSGEIKKNKTVVTKDNNIMLTEEGEYEIIIKSLNGMEKRKYKVVIDKTGPECEIKKNSDGSYNVVLKDINDVRNATIDKFDLEKSEVIEHIDLVEKGLEKSFNIREKGYYILKLYDELDNVSSNHIIVE